MTHPHPPPGWPQRVRWLPFPPGLGGQRFEAYLDRDHGSAWERFEINLDTLEVYALRAGEWRAPGWVELPERLRARLWTLR